MRVDLSDAMTRDRARDLMEFIQRGKDVEATRRGLIDGVAALDVHDASERIHRSGSSQRAADWPPAVSSLALHGLATDFHTRAETLTPGVRDALKALKRGCRRLRYAHQINLFPSMGVAGQFMGLECIRRQLQSVNIDTACFYVCIDYDVASDSRFRVAHVPDVLRGGGFLPLKGAVPEEFVNRPMWSVPRPDNKLMNAWLAQVRQSVQRHLGLLGNRVPRDRRAMVLSRLEGLEEGVRAAWGRADSLATFNAYVLSWLVNVVWDVGVAFIPGSLLHREMLPAFVHLAERHEEMSARQHEAVQHLESVGIRIAPGMMGAAGAMPLWLLCDQCGGRCCFPGPSSTSLDSEILCPYCGASQLVGSRRALSEMLRDYSGRVAPRVIFDNLLDVVGLDVGGGVAYPGSIEHMLVTEHVGAAMGIPLPPHLMRVPRALYNGLVETVAAERIRGADASAAAHSDEAAKLLFAHRGSVVYYHIAYSAATLFEFWSDAIRAPPGFAEPDLARVSMVDGVPVDDASSSALRALAASCCEA